ncbi:hypothetical protein NDU88_001233 [Pleurodeles waltl]|uniref:Uncharacterized protein n=1 Tax=Pleurodeles waltl TaxID=8319 RepID=A0AAV7NAB5_PLEWA|nr:hypothetical protein NDU88_001233 [Pleurodeles waltl]
MNKEGQGCGVKPKEGRKRPSVRKYHTEQKRADQQREKPGCDTPVSVRSVPQTQRQMAAAMRGTVITVAAVKGSAREMRLRQSSKVPTGNASDQAARIA